MELRPTIDREWLERAAVLDPFGHAYARWDLDHAPYRVRFVSALDGNQTVGYLLIWLGHPTATVVHWVGSDPRARSLVDALPARPLVAIVPETFQDAVVKARGPARPLSVLLLASDQAIEPPEGGGAPSSIRRWSRSRSSRRTRWRGSIRRSTPERIGSGGRSTKDGSSGRSVRRSV